MNIYNLNMKKVLIVNTATTSLSNGISNIALMYAKSVSDQYCIDIVMAGRVIEEDLTQIRSIFRKLYKAKYSRVKHFLRYTKWLTSIIRENSYDIIHVHGNSATMFIEINAAERCGVTVRVCHCHSTSCKFKLAHYLLKAPLNHQLTAAAACSEEAGKWLYTRDFTILNNGIESGEYVYDECARKEYRRELGIGDSFVIGHVGYMSDEKNQRFIIALAESLKQNIDDFKVLLIGDGALRSELEQEVSSKSLSDHVLFLGRRNDTSKLYSAMDVFVFPSKFEGFGLALIEAQASGSRCIASDRVPEATKVDPETKYISLEDKKKWIALINRAYQSNAAAKREEASGRAVAAIKEKGFDAASNQQKLINLYEGKYETNR